MSILDGQVVLDGERNDNNNNINKREQRPIKQRNTGNKKNGNSRNYFENKYSFNCSSFLPDTNEHIEVEESVSRDDKADVINRFYNDFKKAATNYKLMKELVTDDFPDVVKYVKSYYSSKNSPMMIDALNHLLDTVATTQFSKVLSNVLESRIWLEDDTYDKCWRNIAYSISVTLIINHVRMHEDAIRKYVSEILPRIWAPEIQDIVHNIGVTKDLALDLIIAIPMIDSDWNSANIDAFYDKFLEKMIQHAEDNMDILNYEIQGMLYDKMFGTTGKVPLKIIGKYLASEPMKPTDSEVENAVYEEFVKMLYTKLDAFDIKDIVYVFNYVNKVKGENPNKKTIFISTDATKYENVRKGLLQLMDDNPESMNNLA